MRFQSRARALVGLFVLDVARMPAAPLPVHLVLREQRIEPLPQIAIGYRRAS